MSLDLTFRPIDVWPGELRRWDQRVGSPFRASYSETLDLLERELRHLRAKRAVLQLALPEGGLLQDGSRPRADARPDHPGVILAFDSIHGPLKYATDVYDGRGPEGWRANLRAIALGLEALRRVDRYGIARRGEQYTGWKALGAGIAMPAASGFSSLEEAARFMWEAAGMSQAIGVGDILDDADDRIATYRAAARMLHPDAGGDPEQFKRLTEAKRMLDEARS